MVLKSLPVFSFLNDECYECIADNLKLFFPGVLFVKNCKNNTSNDSGDDFSRVKRNENRPFCAHQVTFELISFCANGWRDSR